MAASQVVPIYFDRDDRRKAKPVELKTRGEIKAERKAGTLDGTYVDNGAAFVIYRPVDAIEEAERKFQESMFEDWRKKQSGYAGPLVMQLRT